MLEADLRCLDAHAHLGNMVFRHGPHWALSHSEVGVRIGELSLGDDFDGIDGYRDDALYPRIVRAVDVVLARGTVVAPVDVLVEMGLLEPTRLQDWRSGGLGRRERESLA
jgi:hypothetical protein